MGEPVPSVKTTLAELEKINLGVANEGRAMILVESAEGHINIKYKENNRPQLGNYKRRLR